MNLTEKLAEHAASGLQRVHHVTHLFVLVTKTLDLSAEVLDHFLVSRSLKWKSTLDIVHLNVDYPRLDDSVASDHEPIVASIKLRKPPRSWSWWWSRCRAV